MKFSFNFVIFTMVIPMTLSELVCDGKDQTLSEYTPLCPLTCQTIGMIRCMGMSKTPSCQCVSGKIMDEQTKQCVDRKDCPKRQKTTTETPPLLCDNLNEHYSETTPACPSTCKNRNGLRCFAILMKPSCQCNTGTVRDTVARKCVAPEDCPK